ncbi:MAG: PD40 domain-containing protein [Rubrobacter sp.]|nr:PD40 domain-containing protein [Rubrobacter sp.]
MRRIIVALMLTALVVFAVAGAAVVLVAPTPAMAEFPGDNGRIAFMRQDADGFWQTWVANKDLSNRTKLTSKSADSGWAVWKPGGAKLAFDSNRADPDPTDSDAINDIFKMNPDGTGIVKLTHSDSFSSDAGWSPDGSKIAFASDRRNGAGRQEIFVMDADGSHVRRVSTLPEAALYDLAPRFSPNGKQLVFTRYRTDPGTSALFTVRVDGSGLRQLTPWGNGAGDADWSPGGKKLVFEAYPNKGCFGEIYTVEADGQHLTNITDNRCRSGSADPVWSPNGKKILFMSAHAFSGGFGFGLATMNPDGSARHFILPNPKEMHQPDWESVP